MTTPATAFAATASAVSPYPPSFDGSAWRYGGSLFSLLCIAMLCAIVIGWMTRDQWRNRFIDHPRSPRFLFRAMMAFVGVVGVTRCVPEIAFMTCFGEVTGETMGRIMAVRRFADMVALPNVLAWQVLLVLLYPHVMLALNSQSARGTDVLDPLSIWPRLARSAVIVCTIAVISLALAIGKGALGHHA